MMHKTWWDVAVSWLQDRLRQLSEAFAHHVHLTGKTSVAVGDVILALASAVVLIVALRLIAGYVRERAAPASAIHEISPRLTADELYARSTRAAASGEYNAAITLLFRAALAALDIRGAVHDEPSRTVNECRRELRERASRLLPAFDALARIFTAALYADAPVTAVQWNEAREAYAQLRPGRADVA